MKLMVFKGFGNEDRDQFWFVTKAVWTSKNITDDDMKKEQLVTDSQDCALMWYIKYYTDNPLELLANTHTALNKDF